MKTIFFFSRSLSNLVGIAEDGFDGVDLGGVIGRRHDWPEKGADAQISFCVRSGVIQNSRRAASPRRKRNISKKRATGYFFPYQRVLFSFRLSCSSSSSSGNGSSESSSSDGTVRILLFESTEAIASKSCLWLA